MSRHPDALYEAYSLCVGEIWKGFFLVKLHAFKLFSTFAFFLLIFVGLTTRSKFCLVSSVFFTIKHSVRWHGSTGNSSCQCRRNCFQNWRSLVENFEIWLCCHRKRKERKKFFETWGKKVKQVLRQDPIEAILVIFGRRALIFLVWKLLEKTEKWHHFWAHAQWWAPWRRKNVEKGHLAPSSLTFLLIAIDRNGFCGVKDEGHIYKTLPQIF